ncbi:hypothetical protein MRX96_043737 [Rhipicephalus microplus]
MVFHKVWRPQHHRRSKRTNRHDAGCMARLDVKIKKHKALSSRIPWPPVTQQSGTISMALVATKAGAVPIAVLLHNEQSKDGYVTAFGLLKDKFPAWFGGLPVPKVCMADHSTAEKAALQQMWPTVRQLLCPFSCGSGRVAFVDGLS